MSSKSYVWVYLPGDLEPTVCGVFQLASTVAGPTGSFLYGASYLKNKDAIALDPIALPLRQQQFFTTSNQGVFGSLLDALPDDWGRYVIDKVHGKQAFPVGYMLHTSGDAIGNLAFSPDPKSAPLHVRAVGAESLELARSVLLDMDAGKEVPSELVGRVRANTAMGGARPKLTIEKDGRLWLAKFPARNDDPLLPVAKLEAAMLNLARVCGIESARAHVVHGDVLLVERFDRGPVNEIGQSRRDGFLSARTLFESSGVRYDYAGSYARLAVELGRYSCQASQDKVELFRRMVFNAVISNTDDHERNHGLIADDDPGSYRLSPAYDLVPRIHGTTTRYQAMIVGGVESAATKKNLLADCEVFGLDRAQAIEAFSSISELVRQNWRSCLVEMAISKKGIEKLAGCFSGLPEA